jgi:hypothetical protein
MGLSQKAGLYLALLLATSALIPSALAQGLPSFGNVVIVVGENQNYSTSYNPRQHVWPRSETTTRTHILRSATIST